MKKGKGKKRRKRESRRDRKKEGEGERKDARTHGHSGDFILCPMLCIALDKQKFGSPYS